MDPDYYNSEVDGRIQIHDNVLTIKRLNPLDDPAMYQCRANNQQGTTFSSGQLRVLSK